MQNVYDIKRDKNLNFILPKNVQLEEVSTADLKGKVLVIIHLHYLDTVVNYIPYIEEIPDYANIIITASDSRIEQFFLESSFRGKERCKILHKENRGRDISSFLVAGRTAILKHEYVCFVHDKKEKSEKVKEDTEKWIYSLWENSLASTAYINNIIITFLRHPNIGVLVPPLSISKKHSAVFRNTWYSNFSMMEQLAKKLSLNCNLNDEKRPITIGTVFWARVDALKKLFEVAWRYEDFDPEPLKADGTLSHVIERCFAYVAQDAGYDTGWAMTDIFAGERIHYEEEVLQQAFRRMELSLGIRNISDLDRFEEIASSLSDFCMGKEDIYIYGAGKVGKRCLLLTNYLNVQLKAFLVTVKAESGKEIQGKPILAIEEADISDNYGIIVAVGPDYQQQVLQQICKKGYKQERIYVFI